MSKKIVLVDGSSYLYRAFHAMPNLANSRGESTGAVYGIVNMLRRLMREQDTPHFVVVFDARGRRSVIGSTANIKLIARRCPMSCGRRLTKCMP